jgi:hypothetical protein
MQSFCALSCLRAQVYRELRSRKEDARAQAAYGIHSAVNKILIINREIVAERITVVLVGEAVRF